MLIIRNNERDVSQDRDSRLTLEHRSRYLDSTGPLAPVPVVVRAQQLAAVASSPKYLEALYVMDYLYLVSTKNTIQSYTPGPILSFALTQM